MTRGPRITVWHESNSNTHFILITLSNIHEVSCITQIIMIDDVRATIPFGQLAPEIVSGGLPRVPICLSLRIDRECVRLLFFWDMTVKLEVWGATG
jgi:hypothetical protein